MTAYVVDVGKAILGTGEVVNDATLGVEDGVFTEVTAGEPQGTYDERYDLRDRTAIPGLIDAHTHLNYTGEPEEMDVGPLSDEYLAIRGVREARKALDAGFTTLADVAARGTTAFAVRDALADGLFKGPRIKACGNMIAISGGRATGGEPGGSIVEVNGADDARRVTRELLMYHGADLIKLAATGALSSPHTGARDPQLTVAEMRAATEEAHNCGRPVHAHCYGERGISNALEAGVDVIVHGQTLTDDHLDRMERDGTMLAPTLTVFRVGEHTEGDSPIDQFEADQERPESSAQLLAETKPNFQRALDRDIPIVMGTDSGMPYTRFGDNGYDLYYMVDWGMEPMEAIRAATMTAAKSLHSTDTIGSIEAGKHADMVLLRDDPLADMSAVLDIEQDGIVVKNGAFIDAAPPAE